MTYSPATVEPLATIKRWYAAQGWQPFAFQEQVWNHYVAGDSGLIYSPTGSGKTYAVWMAALLEWLGDGAAWQPTRHQPDPPLRVLWITPLRALAEDTAQSLRRPLAALGIPWLVETRTGDTTSSVRARQRRRLPTVLITTPESLSLMLTWPDGQTQLANLRLIVADEWHELLGSKRGTQAELALARLRRWSPQVRTWGLSATLGNLDIALAALLGQTGDGALAAPRGQLIQGDVSKPLVIESLIPSEMERLPWAGHLGLKLLPQVLDVIRSHRTTLVFCNTRHQVERWYDALLEAEPELAGLMAVHHSSIDAGTRAWIEESLRTQQLRCVVCTSSLDLGVDFPEVEAVFQIGSPKGVARLMQRAGRSGHRPGEQSRVVCVPTHAFELLEVSAARQAIQDGVLEERRPIAKPLDVLVQHLVTLGLGGGFEADDLYREVKTAYSYRDLSPAEWQWAVSFVTDGGQALQSYNQYHRLHLNDGKWVVSDKQVATLHRLSIGTIVGDAVLEVQYLRGGKIGQIEESFVSRLKKGDHFTLGGKTLEFVRLYDLKVWVRKGKGNKGVIPRWYGGKLPLSETLAHYVRQRLDQVLAGRYIDAEMQSLRPIFDLQRRWSRIPASNELLIERLTSREGQHVFCYPLAGRLVHEGLAALVAFRLSQLQPSTFTLAANDYGFEILSPQALTIDDAMLHTAFRVADLRQDIIHSLNAAEMARRQFREIARIAGLVYTRYPGGQKTTKQLQTSSSLIYDVLDKYDPTNMLLDQARREVLDDELEYDRLSHVLARIAQGSIVIQPIARPTPLAFPLLVERLRQTVSSETLEARILRMVNQLEKAARW